MTVKEAYELGVKLAFRMRPSTALMLAGGAGGGLLGGGIGALSGENTLRNALIGAGVGTGLGGLAGRGVGRGIEAIRGVIEAPLDLSVRLLNERLRALTAEPLKVQVRLAK